MEINWVGEGLDTIASLAGKYGRWLNVNHKRACFIVWSVCTLYWAIRDFNLGLYSQCISCVFSVALNLYGLHKWKKPESQKGLNPMTSYRPLPLFTYSPYRAFQRNGIACHLIIPRRHQKFKPDMRRDRWGNRREVFIL